MKCCSYRKGYILKIDYENKLIVIAKDKKDIYTYTWLVYSDKTIIMSKEYKEIPIEELSENDYVFVYHSIAVTFSIPPQTYAYIIEVKK